MNETETQTVPIKRARRVSTPFSSSEKVGKKAITATLRSKLLRKHYDKLVVLQTPEAIEKNNPDKHFVWINYNKLMEQGGWHHEGYSLYKTSQGDGEKESFQTGNDGLVRRREMVLAYLPMEEYEERQITKQILNEKANPLDILKHNENLKGFSPNGERTVQRLTVEEELAQGG